MFVLLLENLRSRVYRPLLLPSDYILTPSPPPESGVLVGLDQLVEELDRFRLIDLPSVVPSPIWFPWSSLVPRRYNHLFSSGEPTGDLVDRALLLHTCVGESLHRRFGRRSRLFVD